MNFAIEGNRALLACACAGMGRQCALALARAGVDLFVSVRGEPRLLPTAREIDDAAGARVTPSRQTIPGRVRSVL